MRKFQFKITDDYNDKDIKTVLKSRFSLSERLITKLKVSGGIVLNDKPAFTIKHVVCGDVLEIILPDEASENIVPNEIPIDILYEDDDILAVNKAPGMPTHPSVRHYEGTLANAVCAYYKEIPFTFRAITRLDRYTSGTVIIAKNSLSAHILSDAMQSGKFKKTYYAVCTGAPSPADGLISAPIKRAEGIIKRTVSPDGKSAVSEYETLEVRGGLSLVKLSPLTGRTHQLRLHLAHIGTPIYGDFLYGLEIPGEHTRLHCGEVSFPHPFTGETVCARSPLPADMRLTAIQP